MKNNFTKILIASTAFLVFASGASFASADTVKINIISSVDNTLEVGKENTVRWQTENFPSNGFVHINLIRKVSDNPASYELVRQIASYTVNDGEETWVPERGDVGENTSIEVVCAGTARFKDGCVSTQGNDSFAIKSSFGSNLAGAFSAFFDKFLAIFIK